MIGGLFESLNIQGRWSFSVVSDWFIGDREILTVKFCYRTRPKIARLLLISADIRNNISK
jgi:hypothetical protein